MKLAPLPIFSFRKEGKPASFEAPDEGMGFSLFGKEGGIQVGPALQLQGKRREKDVGAAVGNVGWTAEAGAFIQAYAGENLRFRLEGRRGIGGHEGWLGDVSADFIARRGDSTIFSIGPRLRLSNARYNRAYFGVTPAVAAKTALAPYDPGAGIRAVGVTAGLTQQLSDRFGLYAYAGYDRLVGDAARSPIVRTYGSRSQPSAGIGLTYSFTVKRGRKAD
jgi:outer membrane scaffolding protein for murein synthesis (MipA/OmpV family)